MLLGVIFGINFIPLQSDRAVDLGFADIQRDNAVLFFGFPSCKKVCPVTLARLSKIMEEIPASQRPTVIFINIDLKSPPGISSAYAKAFNPEFIGLLPTLKQLNQLTRDFGLNIRRIETDMEHRGRTYFVRKEKGEWHLKRTYNPNEMSLQTLLHEFT